MQRKFVSSSDLLSVGFCDNVLEIEFRSGGIYQYYNVPFQVYSELMSASSHGKFFHRHIKNFYRYRRIA